jgi:hypothetical protein
MDVIPLDATLVKGSHGAIPKDSLDHPIFVSKNKSLFEGEKLEAVAVMDLILKEVFEG